MEFFILIVPIVLTLLALFAFHKDLNLIECIAPTLATLIVILIMRFFMHANAVSDTEYYSAYIVSVSHYDHWDEWIDETCSETTCDSDGKNCNTTYYDCSYREDHPEYWEAVLNTGEILNIDESYYLYLVKEWGNSEHVEMNRDYYRIDGDAQISRWKGDFNNVQVYDSQGTYVNKTQASETVFLFYDLNESERKQVYDYPEVNKRYQQSCIGCKSNEIDVLRKVNGLLGRSYQIKIFVLVFKDKSVSVAELQRRFWKGGNKNELVICVDSQNRWAKSFSWQDNKLLETKTNKLFSRKDMSLVTKIAILKQDVQKYWKRKEFKDYEYIEVGLSTSQLIWILGVSTVISVFLLWFGVKNQI